MARHMEIQKMGAFQAHKNASKSKDFSIDKEPWMVCKSIRILLPAFLVGS